MFPEHIIPFDASVYDFPSVVRRIFDVENLQQLHTLHDIQSQITFDEDTKTWFHKKYYTSEFYPEMVALYNRFVKEQILPLYRPDTEFAVQIEPSFRVQLPNNTALGSTNSDEKVGLHCDADYNHQPGEINFIVPITPMFGTNSVFVESEPNLGDYHSVNIPIGSAFCFYGNKCRHYNVRNDTGLSRVSIDFRIIPMSKYISDWDSVSVHGKRPLKLGGYFNKINADHT